MLIDHDNVTAVRVEIWDLLTAWIDSLEEECLPVGVISVRVRAYGGWYREHLVTDARYRATAFYQDGCPSVFTRRARYFRTSFEFADSFIPPHGYSDMPPRITHTVAPRPSAQNVAVQTGVAPCTNEGCQLSTVKRWIKRRHACTKSGCTQRFSDYFERTEQKQVDVLLALDTLLLAQQASEATQVAVVSDDVDMLPALAAAAVSRSTLLPHISHVRLKEGKSYLDDFLTSHSIRIVHVSSPTR